MVTAIFRRQEIKNKKQQFSAGVYCLFLFIIISLFISPTGIVSAQQVNYEQISTEITTYFRAARAVISDNQDLINNPDIGNKDLTATKVEEMAKNKYYDMTSMPLPFNESVVALTNAIRSVMDQAQDNINKPGVRYKNFLPAVFAKKVADAFNREMRDKMFIKLTAPSTYVRNLANHPDSWEATVLDTRFSLPTWTKGKAFFEENLHRGKQAFRFILPEYYGNSCLKCHGEPKGSLDITGGRTEGGKLGELGGAISLAIYK
ncbi:MAG: DUF3365 domain-containing protein [Deltaproteobacteria bacterium]|nr:DUF3365 domain-containing protein [Deltaproteobacteria bacterium]